LDSQTRKSYEKSARRYLKNVSERFSFTPVRGIYQGKSDDSENQGREESPGGQSETPLHVNVRRDRVAIAISALTLVFLVATVIFTRKQWLTMNATLCEMQKQTAYAKTTSETAIQSQKDSEQFFRADQRAWVGLKHAEITTFKPNQPIEISITLINTGKTPTINLRDGMVPATFLKERDYPTIKRELDRRRKLITLIPATNLVPGQTLDISASGEDFALNDAGYAKVLGGLVNIYLGGRVEFLDVSQHPQWVDYCVVIKGEKGKATISTCPFADDGMSYQTLPKEPISTNPKH
jgi:hypothetical protein